MKHLACSALVLSLLAADLCAQSGRRGRRNQAAELEHYTMKVVDFDSKAMRSEEGRYAIFVPKEYDDEANAKTEYPWVIWLHGINNGYSRFHTGGGSGVLDQLVGADKVPAMILVAVSAPSRTAYLNGENAGDIETMVLQDVSSHVQKNYRVRTDRTGRGIMGVSMGGMGALKMAMRHPTMFGVVAAHSSAIMPADPADLTERSQQRTAGMLRMMGLAKVFGDPIDPKKWAAEMPMALVRDKEPAVFKNLAIYFDAGTDDRYGFGPPNQQLHEAMTKRELKHTFRMVEGGGHAWSSGSMKPNLQHSLQFVGDFFRQPTPAPGEGTGNGKDEKKSAAGKSGK